MKKLLWGIFPIILLLAFINLSSYINAIPSCGDIVFNDSFNYADLFANHGWTYSSGQASNTTPIIYNNPFTEGAFGYDQRNNKGSIYSRTITKSLDYIYSTYDMDIIPVFTWNFSFKNSDLNISNSRFTVEFYYSGMPNSRLRVELTKDISAYTNISVSPVSGFLGTDTCNYEADSLPLSGHMTFIMNLSAQTYDLYLNDTKICTAKQLNSTFSFNRVSLHNILGDFETLSLYVDDFFMCEELSECSLSNPSLCPHVGGYCMDAATFCSDAFILGGLYYCEIINTVACECASDMCVSGAICTEGYESCCSPPINETSNVNCMVYNSTGNVYQCSSGGWTLLNICSFGCTESLAPTFSFCNVQQLYYCYFMIPNVCYSSSVNATGKCYLNLNECITNYASSTDLNATQNQQTHDLAVNIENFWCTVGICSIASRVIIALIFMLITAGIIVYMTIRHGAPVTFGAVMIIEIIEMILFVYIKLLPIWIPIVFTICGVGIFALTISTKLQSGSG